MEWQAGFDALLKRRVNHVVPLIAYDLSADGLGSSATVLNVHQQTLDHVLTAASAGKSERNAYLSLRGTKAQILAQAAALNNRNIVLGGVQRPTMSDVSGNLKVFPEWGMALLEAGMRAAVEVGTPLTQKYINTSGVTQDSSWDPLDGTDAADLILGGVMFVESIPSKGFRIVRDLTTYLIDDRATFFQDSASTALNHIAYSLRDALETAFIGLKAVAFPATPTSSAIATVANIKALTDTTLNAFRDQNIIVDQQDSITGERILGYDPKNTKVRIASNVASVKCEVNVVNGLDFEEIEIALQIPQSIST